MVAPQRDPQEEDARLPQRAGESPAPSSEPRDVPALTLEGVRFAYHGTPVVENVTLHVARGAMVGLLGPNGAGKSTLLKLASGILSPSRGSVYVRGENVARLPRAEVARRIAVVPQDFSVQFAYTVAQVVELGRLPHRGAWGVASRADQRAVGEALATTHTEHLAERVFNELSGGERQRVLLALALAQDAALVLLDEPTAHLDIKHQIEVLELLRRLNAERQLSVVAVLHDLNLAARYFPRLVLLQRGAVVADGPPARVLESALLSRVYGTNVQVGILRGGEYLSVLPPGHVQRQPLASDIPLSTEREAVAQPRVHVLAGGGSGELLMRTLADAGIAFSAGPLNVGDSDYALAQRLAVQCIAEPPYAPVSPQGLAAARDAMAASAATVLCPTPLGSGNIALLDAALAARHAGAAVLLLEPARATLVLGAQVENDSASLEAIRARDFTERAPALYEALLAAGAQWALTPGDVVRLLAASGGTH